MQLTTNFKLKKIELADSPPDITVLNFNWDTIDTNLKEALDKAKSWDTFQKNGGEIAGAITSPSGKHMMYASSTGLIGFRPNGVSSNVGAINLLAVDADKMLAPIENGAVSLGGQSNTWRDVFLSGFGGGQNGYTKLPNGFILQWGLTEITIPPTDKEALSQNVTLPVTFPTKSIATWAQVVNLTSQAGGAYKASFYSVISNVIDRATLWLYARTSNVSILTPTDTGLKIYWFALGH